MAMNYLENMGVPLLIGEKVVSFQPKEQPRVGIVKWLGKLKEMGPGWVVGLEFNSPVPNGLDGRWGNRQLFKCKPECGVVVPADTVIRESLYKNTGSPLKANLQPVENANKRNPTPTNRSRPGQQQPPAQPLRPLQEQKMTGGGAVPLPSPRHSVNLPGEQNAISEMLESLQSAIASGRNLEGAQLAKQLAHKLNVEIPAGNQPEQERQVGQKSITIDLYVEDHDTSRGPIPLSIKSNMTLGELKDHVTAKLDIPVAVQQWIIGRDVASDDSRSLASYSVTEDGCPVYLFLVTPKPKTAGAKKYQNLEEASEREKLSKLLPNPKPLKRKEEEKLIGWTCPACTYVNKPTRPGCEICSEDRPPDYHVPQDYQLSGIEKERVEKEKELDHELEQTIANEKRKQIEERIRNCSILVKAEDRNLVPNPEPFECTICYVDIPIGEGVRLHNCLHQFCKDCLTGQVQHAGDAVVVCPFINDDYHCETGLQDREIKAILDPEGYQKYLNKCLTDAENQIPNSFHCKTPDCTNWCVYEDEVNLFSCVLCQKVNCLTCQTIHEGMTCKEYQDKLKRDAELNVEAKKTQEMVENMITQGEAMKCPGCQIVIMKKSGCDWIRCPTCKTEICWVTKGPRWGPKGTGDTTGGCRCRTTGNLCDPKCGNCH